MAFNEAYSVISKLAWLWLSSVSWINIK